MSQIHGALRAIRRKSRVNFEVFLPQVGVALDTLGSKWLLFGSAEPKFPHLRPHLCPAKDAIHEVVDMRVSTHVQNFNETEDNIQKLARVSLTSEIPEEGWGEVSAKCQSRGALKVVRWTLDVSKRRRFRAGRAGKWTRFLRWMALKAPWIRDIHGKDGSP